MFYGFTITLSDAFPNELIIGFTGTPIERAGANTRTVYDAYIIMQ